MTHESKYSKKMGDVFQEPIFSLLYKIQRLKGITGQKGHDFLTHWVIWRKSRPKQKPPSPNEVFIESLVDLHEHLFSNGRYTSDQRREYANVLESAQRANVPLEKRWRNAQWIESMLSAQKELKSIIPTSPKKKEKKSYKMYKEFFTCLETCVLAQKACALFYTEVCNKRIINAFQEPIFSLLDEMQRRANNSRVRDYHAIATTMVNDCVGMMEFRQGDFKGRFEYSLSYSYALLSGCKRTLSPALEKEFANWLLSTQPLDSGDLTDWMYWAFHVIDKKVIGGTQRATLGFFFSRLYDCMIIQKICFLVFGGKEEEED